MIPALETPRLQLRPLEVADAAQAQEIFPHWEVVRYLSNIVPWPFPPDGVFHYYRDSAIPAMERGEEWHWSLRLKSNPDQMIGSIALMKSENHNRGFWLGIPWQGRGLMSEAVSAANDFWFDRLGFSVLRSPKAASNTASRRISENTGMRLIGVGEKDYVSGRLPSELWELTAEEWRAFRKNTDTK